MPVVAEIVVVREPIQIDHVRDLAAETFGDLVKPAVDVDRAVIALGGEMHADEEAMLIELGSDQRALWGTNLYPDDFPNDGWIEFDSMSNIRPAGGNRSRDVEDPLIRQRIVEIVQELVLP